MQTASEPRLLASLDQRFSSPQLHPGPGGHGGGSGHAPAVPTDATSSKFCSHPLGARSLSCQRQPRARTHVPRFPTSRKPLNFLFCRLHTLTLMLGLFQDHLFQEQSKCAPAQPPAASFPKDELNFRGADACPWRGGSAQKSPSGLRGSGCTRRGCIHCLGSAACEDHSGGRGGRAGDSAEAPSEAVRPGERKRRPFVMRRDLFIRRCDSPAERVLSSFVLGCAGSLAQPECDWHAEPPHTVRPPCNEAGRHPNRWCE